MALCCYKPPCDLEDFEDFDELGAGSFDRKREWTQFIQSAMKSGRTGGSAPQFYDATFEDPGETVPVEITWNAFPKSLVRRYGRQTALALSDRLCSLAAYDLDPAFDLRAPPPDQATADRLGTKVPAILRFRPQDEYCEWHVERDGRSNLRRVIFTCEPMEYWGILFGEPADPNGRKTAADKQVFLENFQRLVGPGAILTDIINPAQFTPKNLPPFGIFRYNPYNRWNTCRGIVHLSAPMNSLRAEIDLAARATRLVVDAHGRVVDSTEVLMCGTRLGNLNRHSDVAIAGTINAIARLGRKITLADPVGLCIDHIDLAGWKTPRGIRPEDCVQVVRGKWGSVARLVVEMPARRPDLHLGDLRISDAPLKYGGQIAECITMKMTGISTVASGSTGVRSSMTKVGFVRERGGSYVFQPEDGQQPAHTVRAFVDEIGCEQLRCSPPTEPELELDQIQGIAVPGFFKPHQTLLCVRFKKSRAPIRRVRTLLRTFVDDVCTGAEALADRRSKREARACGQGDSRRPLIAIGFSYQGLRSLVPAAEGIRSEAFKQGLAGRSGLLGDPTESKTPGHPSTWVVGGAGDVPDFVIVIAGDERAAVDLRAESIEARVLHAGMTFTRQNGDRHERGEKGREHFGFVDALSQPGIRGRASRGETDFVTPRHVHQDEWPASALNGYPGQDLVWPGELVLGYPATGPDPLLPGPMAEPDLPWMRNGSYLVYTRLLQDVGVFWQTMREQAERLSTKPGFVNLTAEELASRLVGRTPDGVPINRRGSSPERCLEELANDPLANNNFRFDSDTPRMKLVHGVDAHPLAKADPLGVACPLVAHIRKANPRDSVSDMGGESAAHQHRILRVGVPFGPRRPDRFAPPSENEPPRGVQFMCIQSSIEQQFEFLQARWMNDPKRPRAGGGHDMLAGRNSADPTGQRHCDLVGSDGGIESVRTGKPFITSSGGGYFFVPSIGAIRRVLAATGRTRRRRYSAR